jgi:hypothetical protein
MVEVSQKVQYYNWQHPIFSSPILSIMSNKEQKTECDVDFCPGLLEDALQCCQICLAAVHPTCFSTTIRKLPEYPDSCHDEVFCCGVCCQWHGKKGLDLQAIRDERTKLLTLKKKDLVKEASAAKVRVTQRINGASRQISKANDGQVVGCCKVWHQC